jgi:predicted acyltransferase
VASARATAGTTRLLSLDVMRGLAIAGMILVNHPGDPRHVWPPLAHATWDGCAAADLVFPTFLFIVGVAITLSLAPRLAVPGPRGPLVRRIVRRSVILFLLGLALNAVPSLDLLHLRVPGILQRIGLCYLLASLVFLGLPVGGQGGLVVVLLAGYCFLMTRVPVPGVGAGVLEPDTNLGAWIDRLLLDGHLGRGSWDPEALLGTLPALATTLLGVLAGHWMRGGGRGMAAKSAGLVAAGAAGIGLGMLWGHWLPVNKSLWSSSYAVLTAGVAALLLGVCCWLVDVRGHRWLPAPFVVFGSNPIALYVLATLVAKLLDAARVARGDGRTVSLHALVYQRAFASWAGPTGGSLLFSVAFVLVWLAPMTVLYRRGLFFKV